MPYYTGMNSEHNWIRTSKTRHTWRCDCCKTVRVVTQVRSSISRRVPSGMYQTNYVTPAGVTVPDCPPCVTR